MSLSDATFAHSQGGLTEPNRAEFAKLPIWLNALYYFEKSGTYDSLVVSPKFFASDVAGRTNPLLELNAMLELFKKPSEKNALNPQCLYPYRYKILRRYFQLPEPVPCSAFDDWRRTYDPTGLSIVYASQYISNPSSAFGHSFILASSTKQPEGLWYTYNYAAAIPDDVSVLRYAWGGLTGHFTGDFSVMPFYQRLFHYGNVENRDLWIYPVRLTTDELDSTLRHLWEVVHQAQFVYYFLDENCAGMLLRAFSTTIPELANEKRPHLYVHPIEIIKALSRINRLSEPQIYPSQFGVMRARVRALNESESRLFYNALRNPQTGVEIDGPRVADALIEYTSFLARENEGELPDEFKKLERSVFVQRALMKADSEPIVVSEVKTHAPHLAQSSMAADIGGSTINGNLSTDLTYRVSLHGQLEPDPGFLDFSAFEFFKISASISSQAIWLKEALILSVENFQDFWIQAPKASWRVKFRFRENLLTQNQSDLFFEGQASYGAAFSVGRHMFYSLVAGATNLGHELPQSRLEIGPEIGFLAKFSRLKAVVQLNVGENFFEGSESNPGDNSGHRFGVKFAKIGVGLSYFMRHNLDVIQENEWTYLLSKNLRGHRSNLNLRWHF